MVVNPLIVEGQVHGGIAQGIAQALYEEAVYDDDGNLVTTTLADYLVPSAADLPSYVTGRTESRAANRLGVKGVGEAGTIASTPAVVNAIVDALRPLGVDDVTMPCTPERVWRAIQTAGGSGQCGRAAQARQSDQTQGNSRRESDRRRHDPGEVRLRPARLAGRGGHRPGRRRGRREGHRRAGRACCRCCGCGWPTRSCWSTSAAWTNCAASATPGTRW